jgi:hypothetical protein
VPCRREAAHVRADLGQDHLGAALADARDGAEKLDLTGERDGGGLDPLAQGGYVVLQVLDVGQHPLEWARA